MSCVSLVGVEQLKTSFRPLSPFCEDRISQTITRTTGQLEAHWEMLPGAAPPPNSCLKWPSPVPTQRTHPVPRDVLTLLWCPSDEMKRTRFLLSFSCSKDIWACMHVEATSVRRRPGAAQGGGWSNRSWPDLVVTSWGLADSSVQGQVRTFSLAARGSPHPSRSCRWKPHWTVSKRRRESLFPSLNYW